MKFLAMVCVVLTLCCCSGGVRFSPGAEKLPDATHGTLYKTEIQTTYASGEDFWFSGNIAMSSINPATSWVNISPGNREKCSENCKYVNHFTLSGIPDKKGDIKIVLYIRPHVGMFTSSKIYSKEYILTVK